MNRKYTLNVISSFVNHFVMLHFIFGYLKYNKNASAIMISLYFNGTNINILLNVKKILYSKSFYFKYRNCKRLVCQFSGTVSNNQWLQARVQLTSQLDHLSLSLVNNIRAIFSGLTGPDQLQKYAYNKHTQMPHCVAHYHVQLADFSP